MNKKLIEIMARAIAEGQGDDFDHAHRDKPHWIETRGESGGRYRDINEPRQPDFLDAAEAALTAITTAGYEIVTSPEGKARKSAEALEQKIREITEMRERGMLDTEIAAARGVTQSAITSFCIKWGIPRSEAQRASFRRAISEAAKLRHSRKKKKEGGQTKFTYDGLTGDAAQNALYRDKRAYGAEYFPEIYAKKYREITPRGSK